MPVKVPAGTQPAKVTLGVRPGDLRAGSSGLPARVEYIEELGDHSIVDLKAGGQRLRLKADGEARVREGETTHLSFDARAAHIFDRASGQRLN